MSMGRRCCEQTRYLILDQPLLRIRGLVKRINSRRWILDVTDRPASDLQKKTWSACRLKPFGEILRSCLQDGFGNPERRKVTHESLVDPLGLSGVDAISNWVNSRAYPNEARFKKLMEFLSKGETEPARLARLKQLKAAFDNKPSRASVKIDTPIGTFHFGYTPILAAVAIGLAAIPLVPMLLTWAERDEHGPVVTQQTLVDRWELDTSATGRAWRELRAAIAAGKRHEATLTNTMSMLSEDEARQAYLDFVTGLVEGSGPDNSLRAELDEVAGYFEVVTRCVSNDDCSQVDMVSYVGQPADALWKNFEIYIDALNAGGGTYGDGWRTIAGWWQNQD